MDSFNDPSLSAYFPGLVDVCINDDGQLVYVMIKEGELVLAQEYVTETETFSIPEKKHFPFTIPRAVEVLHYFKQEDATLYDDLLSYLKRFSALDDEQWTIVTHYIFLTYIHDHPGIDYCPNLLFHAVPERGKSRTGKSVTYVAFRGIPLIELREANIFRYSQYLHGTLFFDLMNVSQNAERSGCKDILLTRYEKGEKCSRVLYPEQGPFNDMVHYDVYGPTIFASNEELHKILDSRCLPIIMPNRPGNYENPRKELPLVLELRERLTAWRAKNISTTFAGIKPIEGISGRLWDITQPMFFVNSLLSVDSRILEEAILTIAGDKNQSRKDTIEGRLVAIIKEITDEEGLDCCLEWNIKVGDVRSRFNQGRPEDRQVSPQWIGKRLKSMSFHNRIVHGYAEIKLTSDEYATLLKQYGYPVGESSNSTNSHGNSLPGIYEQNHNITREVESGRESGWVQVSPDFNSPSEREFYDEKREALEKEGGRSRAEIELVLQKALEEWRKYNEVPF